MPELTDRSPHPPDPSKLTTDALRREITGLRELMETRLQGMDKAQSLWSENFLRSPSELERAISQLRELNNEKFASIQKQFDERDIRSEAAENAAKVAVNAALQAQKEAAAAQNDANAAAITKSEAATAKQIDGILALLGSTTKAVDEKIAGINGRLDRGEGGSTQAQRGQSTIIAIGAVLVSVGIGLAGLFFKSH